MFRRTILPIILLFVLANITLYFFLVNTGTITGFSINKENVDVRASEYSVPESSRNWDKTFLLDEKIYVMPYIGDIDGSISEDWYYFLGYVTRFYNEERIPVAFSFYPTTMSDDPRFIDAFLKMYNSNYIELMQKEFIEGDLEISIERLDPEKVINLRRDIVIEEKEHYRRTMENLGIKNVKMPISYTQLGGRITVSDRKALEEAGIKVYFDVYYNDEIGPIDSTQTYDVIQYGVSFTRDGGAGPETEFRSVEEVISALGNYNREDVKMIKINGVKVIPLWLHQQDFESKNGYNKLDHQKWQIYTETLLRLKQDPNVTFITPSMMYNLRH
jgi:hypothetical protein